MYPALALVSMNMTFNSFAFRSPSSVETWRLSARSVLFPTKSTWLCFCLDDLRKLVLLPNMTMTSLPRSVRTSSIQRAVCWNELTSKNSNSTSRNENKSISSYSWCRKRQLRRLNRECNSELNFWKWEKIDSISKKFFFVVLPKSFLSRCVPKNAFVNRNKNEKFSFYHNCNRIVRSSKYIVFERKSMPIVA